MSGIHGLDASKLQRSRISSDATAGPVTVPALLDVYYSKLTSLSSVSPDPHSLLKPDADL